MPVCELCGADSPKAKRVFLEGSLLMVCPRCAKFGQGHEEEKKEDKKPAITRAPAPYTGKGGRGPMKGQALDTGEEVLREDFHKVISKARNALGITQEELGKRINERKSVIAKLEARQLRPNDVLRKKLEKVLKVSLTERVQAGALNIREERRGVTIGDMIRMGKK